MNDSESLLQVKNGRKLFSFLKGSYIRINLLLNQGGECIENVMLLMVDSREGFLLKYRSKSKSGGSSYEI